MNIMSAFIISLFSIVCDQLSKYFVVKNLKPIGTTNVIKGLLDFTYLENYGAAYGSFQNKKIMLIGFTSVIIIFLLYLILSKKIKHPVAMTSIALVIGGGIGNLIDRVRIGYVVDFIDISPIFSFPIFNIADCCVVVGAALFIIYTLFLESKENKYGYKN